MSLISLLVFAGVALASGLALAAVVRARPSVPRWCFAMGMVGFGVEAIFNWLSLDQSLPQLVGKWQLSALATRAFNPALWLTFSVTYSRGSYRHFLARWRMWLIAAFLLPGVVVIFGAPRLFEVVSSGGLLSAWWIRLEPLGKAVNAIFLLSYVLILMNLERTYRASVGTMRWRIKFVLIGLGVIFGARFYLGSQMLVFSGYDLAITNVLPIALVIGSVLIAVAYAREGFSEIDVYPSRAVLQTSVTLILAGSYLFIVGVLAKVLSHLGNATTFPLQALFVLLAFVVLAVAFLSNRVRQTTHVFISRHFSRPSHDFRQIWTRFTASSSAVLDEVDLCATTSRLLSETFDVLSVSIWLFDEQQRQLVRASSTLHSDRESQSMRALPIPQWNSAEIPEFARPFELEGTRNHWSDPLQEIDAGRFRTGGNRVCVPLAAGERRLGVMLLADRVNARSYTAEEMDLLKCIGDQVAVGLLNIRLTKEMMLAKELEAFQSIAAFFVHDLKNAASTLSLMLQNLPVHFEDPEFRSDALRGIGATVDRINILINRLSAVPRERDLKLSEVDLNVLVADAVKDLGAADDATVVTKLETVAKIPGDREKLRSVVTNLLLNARDALNGNGEIRVATTQRDAVAVLSVSDNGCGMSPAFVQASLFRPFATTKKKGLGIGMFQSKMIVEAHRGEIRVKSEEGSGTTFEIILPLRNLSK